jgi:hypothetical protein
MPREYLTLIMLVIKFYSKEELKINMRHLIRVLLYYHPSEQEWYSPNAMRSQKC